MATKAATKVKKKPATKKPAAKLKPASVYKKALETLVQTAEEQNMLESLDDAGIKHYREVNKLLNRTPDVTGSFDLSIIISDFQLTGDPYDPDSYRITVTDAATGDVIVEKEVPNDAESY